ncbi:CmcI family methyltransferase [Spirulina sp. CCNP1310]|uniref:CmcI family methyltransferase n=1 Tax=Spirulina sp. CCNP1310 TaxID=3110249 RepID=UPI002B1F25EF|nr:CmcI family methyltransferase [Spirulina sp. CCNP1310]MEA5420524.1 CmcI family methyltransferase [Spirulina sp. CCNP1310]
MSNRVKFLGQIPAVERNEARGARKALSHSSLLTPHSSSSVADWLNAADIFVFPSQLEGMPIGVMEAMAKGLPVVATAVSGIPEQLGDTGKLLADPKQNPAQTVTDLVQTLIAWAENLTLRAEIGQACQARAAAHFTEARMLQETLAVIHQTLKTPHDYVSPGLNPVHPDAAFPNMIIGDSKTCNWPYLRREIPHHWYVDGRQPTIGFLSRDEAHILYNLALQFAGKRALEIGCWMGWSACHLALAGVELDVIDPILAEPAGMGSVSQSLAAAGVLDRVNLIPGFSPQAVEELAQREQRRWSLLFIDGDHEAPGPRKDAIACEPFAEPDALVVFHDLASPAVAEGLHYLRNRGWQTLIYQTMQIMGIAWRGNVQPIEHQPDPAIDWLLPEHLQGYRVSGQTNPKIAPTTGAISTQLSQIMDQIRGIMATPSQDLTEQNSVGQVLEMFQQLDAWDAQGVNLPGLHLSRSVCLCLLARHREALAAAQIELERYPQSTEAQLQVANLQGMLGEMLEFRPLPTRQRPWYTALPSTILHSIQTASHNYAYRDIPMIKNPFDFALYPRLLWQIKPRTIIEIGSKDGGSAVWFGDLLDNFGIDGHIYSVDIVKVTQYQHPRVTFLEGNGRQLAASFSPEFFANLPRPLLVIEDADHVYETSYAVLNFFDQYLEPEEYIVIEDGIISDLVADPSYNSGPHRALKQFLKENDHYEIDHHFCDFFGYNLTWCSNGFLKKVAPSPRQTVPPVDFQDPIVEPEAPFLVIDGIFFQYYQTGIARVWRSLLTAWVKSGFAQSILLLDRGGTAPQISGIQSQLIPLHDYQNWEQDRAMLQEICDQVGASLFISTYYTTPMHTPSVFMAYDMIPEMLGADFNEPMWQDKHHGIAQAQAFIGISENTLNDLVQCFPDTATKPRTVAHCGVDPIFSPATAPELEQFRQKYGIHRPYFLLCGPGTGYKNAQLFFRAFSQLPSRLGFDLICTGNQGFLEAGLRSLVPGTTIHTLQLSDEDLRLAMGGAIALVYPSRYEGFGLPVLEALACGCPVITTPNASIPEVAGEAAIYVHPDDEAAMVAALCEVQNPRLRQSLRLMGLQQAQNFSWEKMAATVQKALITASLPVGDLQPITYILVPDWEQDEAVLSERLSAVLSELASQNQPMTLLFYSATLSAEDITAFLAGIALNLMMEGVDLEEKINVAVIPPLHPLQWQVLLPQMTGRILLAVEDGEAIAATPLQSLKGVEL